MPILGLMTAEQVSALRPKNIRRSVFYMYPNGSAPLIGLLTMMKDEVTNDPEFKWWEKRMVEQRTTTVAISSTIIFWKTVSADFQTWAIADGNITFAAGTSYGIDVASTAQFRVGQIIRMLVYNTSAAYQELQGIVTYVAPDYSTTQDRIAFKCIKAPSVAIDYDNTLNEGREVLAIGTAQAEGGASVSSSAPLSTLEVYNSPTGIVNYTQIHTANWQITGTAGKTAVWFDTRGVDPDLAKESAVNNSRYMEYTSIFGTKYENVVSATNVTRFTGGILYFMALFEAGATYGNTAATVDTDDTKRIIANASGTISKKTFNKYLERAFRFNRNKQNELMAFVGNGYLNTMAEMYAGSVTFTDVMPSKETFGMKLVRHVTPFGTVYYKTHPLFNMNTTLMYNALFVDVPCVKYRPMAGRDTTLRRNLQPNGSDYVEDGWLTEAGLEINSPESHLYIQNVTDWSP